MIDLSTFSANVDSERFEKSMQSTPVSGIKPLYISDKGIPKEILEEIPRTDALMNAGRNIEASVYFTEDGLQPAYSFIGDWVSNSSQVLVYYQPGYIPPEFSFTPNDLFSVGSSQGGWWDFSDTSVMYKDLAQTQPVTTDGDNVAVVQDKSGASHNLVSTDAVNNPVWDASTNSVSFNNSDPFLQNDQALWGTMHTAPFTVAMLFAPGQIADPNSLGIVVANVATVSSSGQGYFFAYDDRASAGRNESVLVQVAKGSLGNQSFLYEYNNQFPSQTFNTAVHRYDPSLTTGDADYSNFYKSNTELNSTFSVVNGGIGAPQTAALAVGDLNGAGGNPYAGKLSQLVIIDRLLTTEEMTNLETYFQNKLAE